MFENWFVSHAVETPEFRFRLRKCVIIGMGQVGIACAVAMMMERVFNKLVIQDINASRAEGEVMDLTHGSSFIGPIDIEVGTVADKGKDADVVVITAGAAQKPGESRMSLVERNVEIYRHLIPQVKEHCPHAIILVVTNPVDIMSYVAYKFSGFPNSRIIGTGTVLDTGRFRSILAEKLQLDPRSINAYIVGEHGDMEFPLWSKLNLAGMQMVDEQNISDELMEIYQNTRDAAYQIIERKGYTNWGIGLAVDSIVKAIMGNQQRILPVSTYVNGMYGLPEVFVSFPTIVDRQGADKVVNIDLTRREQERLLKTGNMLRGVIDSLNLE